VAQALLTETSDRVMSFVAEFSGHAFANVRQRIARHLLDLASDQQRPGLLVAPISQQELADAVGTVREVVVRVLRELRGVGVVQTGRDGIVILDPERLAGIGSPSWNESS
jgi:CRP/FNR family cyclic AMP-dependent transcriptional regulator